jgi:4-hydroxy-tetrahydrodipicolinate synthase
VETNPVPVKYALSLAGVMSPEVRPPLCDLSERSEERVRTAVELVGLELDLFGKR